MQTLTLEIAVVGAGGAGLGAAIAAAEADPSLRIALLSKVYPMRSHTVAAEGGAAAVIKDEDSLAQHFDDTVSGGDWLCEQDVVARIVAECPREMPLKEPTPNRRGSNSLAELLVFGRQAGGHYPGPPLQPE